MKKPLLIALLGVVIFLVCFVLVSAVGGRVAQTAPASRGVVTAGALVISVLMTVVALKELFLRK